VRPSPLRGQRDASGLSRTVHRPLNFRIVRPDGIGGRGRLNSALALSRLPTRQVRHGKVAVREIARSATDSTRIVVSSNCSTPAAHSLTLLASCRQIDFAFAPFGNDVRPYGQEIRSTDDAEYYGRSA
jgi:hypothetical protein